MNIRMRTLMVALSMLAALAAPTLSHAYGLSGVGARFGYNAPEDLDGTALVGAHMEFEQPGTRIHLMPSVMMWQSNGVTDIKPNFDLYYHFNSEGMVTPYVGAGLGMNLYDYRGGSSNTELGANLFGGVRFPGESSHFFMEARTTVSDRSEFGLLGGFTYHMH